MELVSGKGKEDGVGWLGMQGLGRSLARATASPKAVDDTVLHRIDLLEKLTAHGSTEEVLSKPKEGVYFCF